MTNFNPNDVELPSTWPSYVASTVRTLLGVAGGYLLARGLSVHDIQTIAGIAVPAGVWVWSMIQKHNAAKTLKAAIIAPTGQAT